MNANVVSFNPNPVVDSYYDSIHQNRQQVNDLKDQASKNIQLLMERGPKLEDLDERAKQIGNQSNQFGKTSSKVERVVKWSSRKYTILIVAAILIGIGLIGLAIGLPISLSMRN